MQCFSTLDIAQADTKKRKTRAAAPRRSSAQRAFDLQQHKAHVLALCAHAVELVQRCVVVTLVALVADVAVL